MMLKVRSERPEFRLTPSADDERVFLVDEALGFRFGQLDGDATCAWKDLSGDEGDLWEFVSSKVSVAATKKVAPLLNYSRYLERQTVSLS